MVRQDLRTNEAEHAEGSLRRTGISVLDQRKANDWVSVEAS